MLQQSRPRRHTTFTVSDTAPRLAVLYRFVTVRLKSDGTTGRLGRVANPRPVATIKTGRVGMRL